MLFISIKIHSNIHIVPGIALSAIWTLIKYHIILNVISFEGTISACVHQYTVVNECCIVICMSRFNIRSPNEG